MDLSIQDNYCGNKNCIGVLGSPYGQIPEAIIIIEDEWDLPEPIIENSITGVISHETIEYLLMKLEPELFCDLHAILGHSQKISDYIGNSDGIVLGKHAVNYTEQGRC